MKSVVEKKNEKTNHWLAARVERNEMPSAASQVDKNNKEAEKKLGNSIKKNY